MKLKMKSPRLQTLDELCFKDFSAENISFKNGKKHGSGVYSMPDGNWYSGEWENNKKVGVGILTTAGGVKIRCQYENDVLKSYQKI